MSTSDSPGRPASYRFLLTRRWLGLLLAVLVVAVSCYELGRWQFHRYAERHDQNTQTRANEAASPVPIDTLMATAHPAGDSNQWRRVVASGHYDSTHQVVVLYRTRDGAPGVDVVVPLVTSSGAAVLVDRGWVQTNANGNEPVDVPKPPTGTVTVTGWLRLDATDTGDRVTPSSGSVRSISSVAIDQTLPYSLYRGFLELTDEQPQISPSPKLATPPDLSAGPSYFYGVQWWFFGLLAFGFFGYFGYAERTQPKTTAQAVARYTLSEATGVPSVDREHHAGDVRRGG